jgi:glycosyltransferase involved in cell wall biosynthesis
MANDDRIRLLLSDRGARMGGAQRVLWELATRLPSSRFDVHVWLSEAPGVDELAGSLSACDLPVERIAPPRSAWEWRRRLATWSRLRALRPQLLHLHEAWPAPDRNLASLARSAGVPYRIVTLHDVGRPDGLEHGRARRPELRHADAITVACEPAAEELVREQGVDRSRVRVVGSGADAPDEEREWPAARRIRNDLGIMPFRPLWVCAARLEQHKGHAVLLDALTQLRDRGLDFVVVIAGDGPLRAALEAQVASAGLAERIRFAGQVDSLGPLLFAADVCVLPSLWEEMPLSMLDALARARPVVASSVGGVPDVIADGITGRLVPPGDATALAAALEDLHRRPDAARRLGRYAAERMRDEFTWQRVVEAYEAVYDEVLGLASFTPAGVTDASEARRVP